VATPTERLRLFVALELPPAVVSELVSWGAGVVLDVAGLRALPARSLHLTLAFLGARPAEELEALRSVLTGVEGHPAGGLALGSPWWLPRRRPGVLSVAVEDDHGSLRELQAAVVAGLRRAIGWQPEARPFFPHVTVARVRNGARVRPRALEGPRGLEFAAQWLTLFRSRTDPAGARYDALHRVRVGG
jgi:2'-5' RNA ligase